jgi:hypothetical protein
VMIPAGLEVAVVETVGVGETGEARSAERWRT